MTDRITEAGDSDAQPRAARGSVKTTQILDAARQMFTANGFGATSMDAVARLAGVSKATVYAHFHSKENLFVAIVQHECRRLERALPGSEDIDTPVAVTLRRLGHRYLAFLMSAEVLAIHRVIVAEAARLPALGRILFQAGPAAMRTRIEAYLARVSIRGQLVMEDPALGTQQLLALFRGDMQLRCLLDPEWRPPPGDVRRQTDAAVAMFLKIYAPPAPPDNSR